MDVASLVATFEAKVGPGIANIEKAEKVTKNVSDKIGGHTKKIEGFLGKWKMGWLAIGAAAIASMYALAKISPIIGGYFSAFGSVLGMVADIIAVEMTPQLDFLLDKLLDFTDWFSALPGWEKSIIGWGVTIGLVFGGAILVIGGLITALGKITGAIAAVTGVDISAALVTALGSTPALIAAATGLGMAIGGWIVFGMEKSGINAWLADVFKPLAKLPSDVKSTIIAFWGVLPALGGALITWIRTGSFKEAWIEAHNYIENTWAPSLLPALKMVFDPWGIFRAIIDFDWGIIGRGFTNIYSAITNTAISGFEFFINAVIAGINLVIDGLNLIPGVDIGKVGSISLGRLPYLKEGGLVLETGAAVVHKGEVITPAGASNFNYGGITVNQYISNVGSAIDVRKMADETAELVMERIRRMS